MVAKNKSHKDINGVNIPLEWHIPEGTITPFASNMVVQYTEGIFKVFFFETKPPLQLDPSEPPPQKVRADCIASVIITPEKLPRFIDALQKQLEKHAPQKMTDK